MNEQDLLLDENEPSLPSRLPRWVIVLIAVLLIFLMVSITLAQFPLGDILRSSGATHKLQESIAVGELTVEFSPQVLASLEQSFLENQRTEISRCLFGEIKEKTYSVTHLIEPEVISRSFNSVTFRACPKETIIHFHTHPHERCLASQTDLNSLQRAKQENPLAIGMIMCQTNKVAFY